MKQFYAVIDTNVLVSALIATLRERPSPPLQILEHVLNNIVIPVYNEEIINEYRDVLSRPKFEFNTELINHILDIIRAFGLPSSRVASEEHFNDSDDIVFYEVTLSVPEAYLITGNIKDFPVKPFVVTPALMLDLIKQSHLLQGV